jgi:hypothetical protein
VILCSGADAGVADADGVGVADAVGRGGGSHGHDRPATRPQNSMMEP